MSPFPFLSPAHHFRPQCSTAPLVKHWCHLRNFRPGCIESSPTYAITIPKKFLPQFSTYTIRPTTCKTARMTVTRKKYERTIILTPLLHNLTLRVMYRHFPDWTHTYISVPVPNYCNRRRTISRFSFLSISTQYRYKRVEGYRRLLSSSFGCMLVLNND
jgi:hypothetical protein